MIVIADAMVISADAMVVIAVERVVIASGMMNGGSTSQIRSV
jgi:hypothetical protein